MTKEEKIERFWSRSTPVSSGCRVWQGSRTTAGYGNLSLFGKMTYAHRVAWELAHGPIPDGLWVLHKCDNPPCCEPLHLFLGTVTDNNRDMTSKGRHFTRTRPERIARGARHGSRLKPERMKRGEDHPGAKLTADAVHAIRRAVASGETVSALARRYSVSRPTINRAVNGKNWRSV